MQALHVHTMNRLASFGKALERFPAAFVFIFANRLAWYFIFPALLHILLLYLSIYSSSELARMLQQSLADKIGGDAEGWGSMLSWIAGGMIWLVLKLLFFIVFAYLGGYIVLIIMSPVLAFLSERTEVILTGVRRESDMYDMAADAMRGILLSLRNMLAELAILVAVFCVSILLGWIPIVGWLLAIAGQVYLLGVAAYFYGFSFVYYTTERRHLALRSSVLLARANKSDLVGTGLPFALCLLIPFVGGFVASFAAIVSTVAGTMTACEILDGDNKNI